jgi:5-methylcytosine-specific restriction enzyme A
MKISNEAMKASYVVAKRVREGALSRSAGIEELHQRFELNRGSAGDTISSIGYMLEGERYDRTINAFATEHFLEMIRRDYGQDALQKALSAVEKHVDYYEGLPRGSKLLKIWKIVHKYRSIAKRWPNGHAGGASE